MKDNDGRQPLHWAARRGCNTVVKLLLDQRADVPAKDLLGQTPLNWPLKAGMRPQLSCCSTEALTLRRRTRIARHRYT